MACLFNQTNIAPSTFLQTQPPTATTVGYFNSTISLTSGVTTNLITLPINTVLPGTYQFLFPVNLSARGTNGIQYHLGLYGSLDNEALWPTYQNPTMNLSSLSQFGSWSDPQIYTLSGLVQTSSIVSTLSIKAVQQTGVAQSINIAPNVGGVGTQIIIRPF